VDKAKVLEDLTEAYIKWRRSGYTDHPDNSRVSDLWKEFSRLFDEYVNHLTAEWGPGRVSAVERWNIRDRALSRVFQRALNVLFDEEAIRERWTEE